MRTDNNGGTGMNRRATEVRRPADLPTDLEQLRGRAIRAINEHTNDGGHCTSCASTWPCERALVAEHNLAAL